MCENYIISVSLPFVNDTLRLERSIYEKVIYTIACYYLICLFRFGSKPDRTIFSFGQS